MKIHPAAHLISVDPDYRINVSQRRDLHHGPFLELGHKGIVEQVIRRATLHALAQPLPGTGRLALESLLQRARLPT
jgi:hypothetical protein